MTGSQEVRGTSALYRPRPLVRLFGVISALALAVGVWANLPLLAPPSLRFIIVLLGMSLVLALVAIPAFRPWRVVVGEGTVFASYLFWSRTIASSAVGRIRVLAEGSLDRFMYGSGNSHTVVLEHRSPRGAPKTTSLTVDPLIYAALRAALSDREWVQES